MKNDWLEAPRNYMQRHIELFEKLKHIDYVAMLEAMANVIVHTYRRNVQEQSKNKIAFFGDEGSFEHAIHFAVGLMARFKGKHCGLEAIALTGDVAHADATDSCYAAQVFARQIENEILMGDVVVGITTSGASKSVLYGLKKARELRAITMALTGGNGIADLEGQRAKRFVDYCYAVPLDPANRENVPLIQIAHTSARHFIYNRVDEAVADVEEELKRKGA